MVERQKLRNMMFVDVDIETSDKINIIKHDYDKIEIDEELKNMCNYEEIRDYKAEQRGISIGEVKAFSDVVYRFCFKENMSLDEAISYINVREDLIDKVKEEVSKKLN